MDLGGCSSRCSPVSAVSITVNKQPACHVASPHAAALSNSMQQPAAANTGSSSSTAAGSHTGGPLNDSVGHDVVLPAAARPAVARSPPAAAAVGSTISPQPGAHPGITLGTSPTAVAPVAALHPEPCSHIKVGGTATGSSTMAADAVAAAPGRFSIESGSEDGVRLGSFDSDMEPLAATAGSLHDLVRRDCGAAEGYSSSSSSSSSSHLSGATARPAAPAALTVSGAAATVSGGADSAAKEELVAQQHLWQAWSTSGLLRSPVRGPLRTLSGSPGTITARGAAAVAGTDLEAVLSGGLAVKWCGSKVQPWSCGQGVPEGCAAATASESDVDVWREQVQRLEGEKVGVIEQLRALLDVCCRQQRELEECGQQVADLKEHCQELELQVTEAHFDREELEAQMNAQAAAAQQEAAAQDFKHKQQIRALQQQVQELLGLLSCCVEGPAPAQHPFVQVAKRDQDCVKKALHQGPSTGKQGLVNMRGQQKAPALLGSGPVLKPAVGPLTSAKHKQQEEQQKSRNKISLRSNQGASGAVPAAGYCSNSSSARSQLPPHSTASRAASSVIPVAAAAATSPTGMATGHAGVSRQTASGQVKSVAPWRAPGCNSSLLSSNSSYKSSHSRFSNL